MTRWLQLTLLLVSLPYVALHLFNHPSADDFSYALGGMNMGFLKSQLHVYETWSGRYFSTAVLSFNPVAWGWLAGYPLVSIANHLLMYLSATFFIREFFIKFKLPNWKLVSLGFLIVLMSHFRSTAQGLYWMAGFVNYTVPVSFLLIGLAVYLSKTLSPKPNKFVSHTLITILIFFIVGANEIIMFQLACVLGVSTVFLFYKKNPLAKIHLFWTLCCGLFSIIVIRAPGNALRASHFEQPNPVVAALKSLGITFEHHVQFLSLPLIVGFLLLAKWVMTNPTVWNHKLFQTKRRYTFGLFYLIIALGFFPPLISMGGQPQPRADNMFYVIYLISFLILAIQTGLKPPEFLNKVTLKTLGILFVVSSLFWINNLAAWRDLFFRAKPYSDFSQNMYQQAREHKGEELVIQDLKTPYPKTLFFDQISKDPADWKNLAFAQFFSLKTIKIE